MAAASMSGWCTATTHAQTPALGLACSPHGALIADVAGDWYAARALGECYLREHPLEADARWLSDFTSGEPAAYIEAVRHRFTTARRLDFEEGRVVIVSGWQLARTEARLCALAALAG